MFIYMCLTTSPQKAILKYLSLTFLDSVSGDHLHSPEVWHHSDRALQSAVQSSRTLVQERQQGMGPPRYWHRSGHFNHFIPENDGKMNENDDTPIGIGGAME